MKHLVTLKKIESRKPLIVLILTTTDIVSSYLSIVIVFLVSRHHSPTVQSVFDIILVSKRNLQEALGKDYTKEKVEEIMRVSILIQSFDLQRIHNTTNTNSLVTQFLVSDSYQKRCHRFTSGIRYEPRWENLIRRVLGCLSQSNIKRMCPYSRFNSSFVVLRRTRINFGKRMRRLMYFDVIIG